jgi:hypothetical protein
MKPGLNYYHVQQQHARSLSIASSTLWVELGGRHLTPKHEVEHDVKLDVEARVRQGVKGVLEGLGRISSRMRMPAITRSNGTRRPRLHGQFRPPGRAGGPEAVFAHHSLLFARPAGSTCAGETV